MKGVQRLEVAQTDTALVKYRGTLRGTNQPPNYSRLSTPRSELLSLGDARAMRDDIVVNSGQIRDALQVRWVLGLR